MIRLIDNFLNKITMYRLALYELCGLLLVAMVLGTVHLVPYGPVGIAYSTAMLFIIAWIINKIFAYAFDAPSNPESTYITALILALIIAPPQGFFDTYYLGLAFWAAGWAVASKYIFAIGKKHLFNPAAFGVAATALFLGQGASWWVGTIWMLPFVAVGGFLVARKIRRVEMVIVYGAAVVFTIGLLSIGEGSGVLHIIEESLFYAPPVFLGTIMLTEPLTTPPTRFLRFWYAALIGFLCAPEVHLGSFYFTPELALLAGNLFSYAVSPKAKLMLTLKERIPIARDTYEFVFAADKKLKFKPGQYLEWTLPHEKRDSRGIRRYFTIASSPNDPDIRVGVKFYQPMSSFKNKLLSMRPGETMIATQLAGDFVLPEDPSQKLVMVAGGIGITPFRSMIEYLIEAKQRRDIVLLYSNRTIADTAYVDLLNRAEQEIGLRIIPIFTNEPSQKPGMDQFPSQLDVELIAKEIPDYGFRTFYISGPHAMVDAARDVLADLHVPPLQIKKDYFPGFA